MSNRFTLNDVKTTKGIKELYAKRSTQTAQTLEQVAHESIDEAYALGKVDGGEELIDKVASMTAAMASIDQHGQMIGVMVSCSPRARLMVLQTLIATCEVINALDSASAVIVD